MGISPVQSVRNPEPRETKKNRRNDVEQTQAPSQPSPSRQAQAQAVGLWTRYETLFFILLNQWAGSERVL